MKRFNKSVFMGLIWVVIAQIPLLAVADEGSPPIDTAKLFQPQRNPYAPHPKASVSTDEEGVQAGSNSSKPTPKDTSITVNGHGNSSNATSGGNNATMRHRFTFD